MALKRKTSERVVGLSMPVNQPREDVVCSRWQIDGLLPATAEPTVHVPAETDRSLFRRHSFRFADDDTDGLGVNPVNSSRSRSPILFRWNVAHERARLI